jgi:hypothetical protein
MWKTSWIGVLLICVAAVCFAQLGTATLTGTITDPSGASVASAKVTLQSTHESFTRQVTSGTEGQYVLTSLPPGSYTLLVHATGFLDRKSEEVVLSSGQVASVNMSLTLAGTATQVTVEASSVLLQTTSASVGSAVSAKQVENLPLLGNSFLNALVISPGVIASPPTGSTLNFSPVNQNVLPSIFGQRQKDNDILLDGVENRDPNFLGVALYPPPEAIAEIKVNSGVGSSVYGHASGAGIEVLTKSGSEKWHGEAWEIFRNNVLDARSFFVPAVGVYRWNQFGVTIGGPLQIPHLLSRRRAWYVSGYYEGVRIRNAANYSGYVPTANQLAGNFVGLAPIYDPYSTAAAPNGTQMRNPYPNNVIPATQLNPSTVTLAKAVYPTPNLAPGQIPGANYLNSSESRQNGDQWDARVDHQFGQHDNFFARYTGASNPSHSSTLPTLVTTLAEGLANAVASDTHIISPSFVVTGRYGLMWVNYPSNNPGPSGLVDQAGLGSTWESYTGIEIIPATTVAGYNGMSFTHQFIGSTQQSGSGDAQKISGGHTIEFGGTILHTHLITMDSGDPAVTFASTQTSNFTSSTGDAMASFLIGAPSIISRRVGNGTNEGDYTTTAYSGYVQDAWRHKQLTINLGLRYDYTTVPFNRLGTGTFDWDAGKWVWDMTNPITGAAANVPHGAYAPEKHAFAPRIGIAYQVTPSTVVRSSYGIFFNTFGSQYIQGSQAPRGSWPFSYPQTASGLNTGVPTNLFPNPFTGLSTAYTPTCIQCLNVDTESTRTPYVQQWTLAIERQIRSDLALEADYFGSHAVKLAGQIVDNTAVVPGPGPISARQVYPQMSQYPLNNFDVFPSWYEAVSLQLKKRFSHGLQFVANYTHSKNLDLEDNLSNAGLGGVSTSNPTRFNIWSNKGPAGFDIPELLVFSGVWSVPGRTGNRLLDAVVSNWQLSGISNFQSGRPFMLFLSTDNENIGGVSGRYVEFPNVVGDPHSTPVTVQRWFNTAAFAVPAPYTIGDVGRNILRTDHLISTDLALSKSWPIRETRSIELRGEFFNAFNHANFGYPGTIIGTAQFGTVSNTLNPGRQLQLVLKLHL